MRIIRVGFTLKTTSLILQWHYLLRNVYRVDPMPTSLASLLAFAMLSEYPRTAIVEYMLAEHVRQKG